MENSSKEFLKDKLAEKTAKLTRDNPAFIHLDMLGLAKTAGSNEDRMREFRDILVRSVSKNANIIIPSFTLSYTKNEEFSILETKCPDVGTLSEYIRSEFPERRTADGLFSYMVFGDSISGRHFEINDYESFGAGSIIEEVFSKDGSIWAIGGVFKNSTEIHFIEKLLQVNYRSDKAFRGKITDIYGKKHDQQVVYFCKNFDYNLWYDFKKLENELRSDGLIETIKTEGYPFFITGIKFRVLYEYVEYKIKKDYKYFIKDLQDKRL